MAPKYKHKRSATEGTRPSTAQVDIGEIAINTHENSSNLHFKDSSDNIRNVGADPVAGASSVDYVRRVATSGAGEWVVANTTPGTGDGSGDFGFWNRNDTTDTLTTRISDDDVQLGGDLSVVGDVNIGGANLSSTSTDGAIIDEDGVGNFQAQAANVDLLNVWQQTTNQFSVQSNGDVFLKRDGGRVSFRGSDDSATARSITLRAPSADAAFTSNYDLVLPPADGAPDEVLTTDGSGNLSWGAGGGTTYWDRDDATDTISPLTANDNVTIGTGALTAGTGSFAGPLAVTTSNQPLNLADQNDSGDARTIGIRAPGAASGMTNWNMTLPATAGTNGYVLSTNGSGNCSWIAQGGGTASTINRVATTAANTSSFRVMLGTANNNAGPASCYVVTDASRLYYQPSTNKLTSGTFAGSTANITTINATNVNASGSVKLGTLYLRQSSTWGIYDTTKRTQNNFGIIHSTEQDVCLRNSKGTLKISDGGSIYLKTNSKSQTLYIRTGTTKPGSTISGYASMYVSKATTTFRISADTEFEMEAEDESKYETRTIDHGDGYTEETREYVGRTEKAIEVIKELRSRCQTLELRNKAVDEQLEAVMTRLAALEGGEGGTTKTTRKRKS